MGFVGCSYFHRTSMISKVKGKTEISPNLPGVLRWFCFASFQGPDLIKSFPVSADLCDQTSMCLLRGLTPLRKIEFGSTRRPRNMLMSSSITALVVHCTARPDGKVVGIERVFFLNQATSDSFSV